MPSFSMRLRSVFGWSLRIRAAPLEPWKHADDDKPSYAADQSIDQAVEPARITWQVQRHYQNGGDRRLNGNHGSAIQQDGDRHRQRHDRSEERRVGKECRSRWSPQEKK